MELCWENQLGALARRRRSDRVFAVLLAQPVDAFVEFFHGAALFAIEQRLLPAGGLQRAGADAEKPDGAAGSDILAQQIFDDFEDFLVEASG